MSNKLTVHLGDTELLSTTTPGITTVTYGGQLVTQVFPETTVVLRTENVQFDKNLKIDRFMLHTNQTVCNDAIKISNELPYVELEYIESSGTQYIDMGFAPNQDTSVRVKAQLSATQNVTYFAATKYRGPVPHSFYGVSTDSYSYYVDQFGTYKPSSKVTADTNIHVIYKDMVRLYVDGTLICSNLSATFQSPSNLYLMAENDQGTISSITPGKFYYCKIYDNGALVRNLIPAQRKSDNVVCMYDTVSNTFFENIGTGVFTAGPAVSYREIPYLESTGTQWVDTGYIPQLTDNIICKASITEDLTSSDKTLFGAIQEMSSQHLRFHLGWNTPGVGLQFITSVVAPTVGTPVTISWNGTSVNYGTGVWTPTPAVTAIELPTNSSYIFARHTNSDTSSDADCRISAKLYSCKIFDAQGLLIHNYTPVQRMETKELGLLDSVFHVFYGNVGIGSFTGGE